jgi:uncharacterized cysteine cluster protein YcgN (CxxCxxCC family)
MLPSFAFPGYTFLYLKYIRLIGMSHEPFWKLKSLDAMTGDEWESLCDGCALCCLHRVQDRKTGRLRTLMVACEYLHTVNCRCTVYSIRSELCPRCVKLHPRNIGRLKWLPSTCTYRILAEGGDLPEWHPLVSGHPETVHTAGISVRGRVVSGRFVHPDDIG